MLMRAPSSASSAASSSFAAEMRACLASRPRRISPKWFYDERGSQLFDAICELPEYYPTRTEFGILEANAPEMASLMGPRTEIVEFGAGSLRKVRLLLDAMQEPARYMPIDISGDHMSHAAKDLQRAYPGLEVHPVVADYTQRLLLPAPLPGAGKRVGFFPGSTIGNFTPEEALHFFVLAGQLLRGGALLLGADLVKDPGVLHAAYNDAQGVTAEFNLNLLARANRELGTDFDLAAFWHSAFYNAPASRIEMHLVSRERQEVQWRGEAFDFGEGESIHTENSYKFTVDSLRGMAVDAGFRPGPVWTDDERLFSVHWLHAPA